MISRYFPVLSLLAATSAAAISERKLVVPNVAAVQPAFPRLDVVGISNDDSIWHKYETSGKGEWSGFESLEGGAEALPPVLTSWGEKRLDLFYVGDGLSIYHSYSGNGGKQWVFGEGTGSPSDGVKGKFAAVAREQGYIDLVAPIGHDYYYYKAYSADAEDPEKEWKEIGEKFSSSPAIASWGPDRLDAIGIDYSGKLLHRFAYKAKPDDTELTWAWEWQDLAGGPFKGDPAISSWGPGRLDIWAIGEDGQLNHKYLQNRGGDWWEWSAWEELGGNFTTAPKVASWDVAKYTLVGQYVDEKQYRQKDLYEKDGEWWHPGVKEWAEKNGTFAGEPSVVAAKGKNWIYVFGIDDEGVLKVQLFDSTQWLPSFDSYYDLGDLSKLDERFLWHQDLKV